MSKVTKEQIKAWKAQYGALYELTTKDDKSCIIFDPTAKLSVMKMVAAASALGQAAVTEAILNNCFLAGDEEFKTNEEYLNELDDQIDEIFDIPDFEIIEESDHAIIQTQDVFFKVKYPTRADLKAAEKRNKKNKPFDTNVYLLEDIAIGNTADLKKNNRVYLGVLLAVFEVKKTKRQRIKKALNEAVITDQTSWYRKADALIRYHMGIDPDTLNDEEWATAFQDLEWARNEERKHSQAQ